MQGSDVKKKILYIGSTTRFVHDYDRKRKHLNKLICQSVRKIKIHPTEPWTTNYQNTDVKIIEQKNEKKTTSTYMYEAIHIRTQFPGGMPH